MFKPGEPRPPGAGRKKGSKNKANRDLHQLCEDAGVDVFKRLLEFVASDKKEEQMFGITNALKYLYPTLRATEITGALSAEVSEKLREIEEMSREEQIAMLEDNLKSLKSSQ